MSAEGRFERACAAAAFAAYLAFQLHANAFHGYWGQDWISHKDTIRAAATDPWEFFTRYGPHRTNPPLYHGLGALLRRALGPARSLPAIGLMNVAFGFAGMCFVYAVIRRLIASPRLRLAALVLVLFLPAAMIHAQVVAADALATPLFWLILWLVLGFRGDAPGPAFAWRVATIALLLVAGILTKFTFGSFILATAAWAALQWRAGLLPARQLAIVLVVVTALPAAYAWRERRAFSEAVVDPFGFAAPPRLAYAPMNPRSIVWLRAADADVLAAPAYNWVRGGVHPLFLSNVHSYPALLHLALFTDVLNVYQHDPYDSYFGRRTERNHRLMKAAVRSGILFSILAVAGVIVLLARAIPSVVFRGDPRELPVLTVLLFCAAWLVNVAAAFPFLPAAYGAGYWLPRLTAPALLGFFVMGFVLLDRLRWLPRAGHAVVLAAVLAQSAVHAAFLWPAPSEDAIHEPNDDVAAAAEGAGAALRVFSWQDGYLQNRDGVYCLEKAIGIVVDRASGSRAGWTLRFDVSPGPANGLGRGTLRLSSPLAPPRTVEFAGPSTPVAAEVPLARRRNEIRVELLSPPPLETEDDSRACMARISGVEMVSRDGTRAVRLLR